MTHQNHHDTFEVFPLRLLQAVSDWQRGGTAKQKLSRGQRLKEACAPLPERFRACSLCCFRQISLPKGGVWSLIGENRLPEAISSWTLDLKAAKAFKGGVPPQGQGFQGVILCVSPKPGSVIVNLHALYQDPNFTAALEQCKECIVGYHDGAGRYGNNQSEVVLEVAAVTQQDIYSLGAHSSSFEELVDIAAKLFYGRLPTPAEREALMLGAEHVQPELAPRWLNPEATQCVIEKMKPHVERLRPIKEEQDATKAQ